MPEQPTAPIPASASRTLRFNRLAALWATIIAAAPTALGLAIDLLGNPDIATAVEGVIPGKYRMLLAAVVIYLAQRNRTLRYQTTAPIAQQETAA
jgi:hypothetical protein